jgi:competence protein ComEC
MSQDNIRRVEALLGMARRGWQALFERWPAVPLAVALMIGIGVGPYLHVGFIPLILVTAACVLAAVLFIHRRIAAGVLLCGAIGLSGVLLAQWHQFYFAADDIARLTTNEPRLAQLRLRLISPPRTIVRASSQRWEPSEETAIARMTQLRTVLGWQPCSGDVKVMFNRPIAPLEVGQTIEVIGQLQQTAPASNPGEFDWMAFYRKQRILADVQVAHPDAVTILSPAGFQPLESLRRNARRLLEDGFAKYQEPTQALLKALVFGDRETQMRDAQEDFTKAGGAYLLAISGLHVLLVGAAVLIFLGRGLNVHPRWATIAAMLVVVTYSLIVVPGTPAVRATVLFLAFGVARLVQRRTAHLQLLALCAMGILIAEPQELGSAGFQLSFVTVAGLIIGAQPMATFLTGLVEDEHDRVARSFRPPGFWGSLGLEIRNFLINGLAMSLVAWLVSMPLILIHFQQVNPWALLAGLILLPLVAVVLIGGLLKILFTLIVPSLALQWATIASAPLSLLKHVVHGLAHLPGAELVAIQPSPFWVAAGYALLLLPLLPWTWPTFKRFSRCSPVMAVLVVCLPAILGTGHPDSIADARVTLLSIGAGQIGIIELPNHDVFLVDDGSTTVTDPLHRCLAPYLQTRGIHKIEAIFLSHPDYDHISAAAALERCAHSH